MDQSKHTPGPWKFASGMFNRPDDENCGIGSIVSIHEGEADPWFICEVEDATEHQANARLIAASPELYEACAALIQTDDLQRAIDLARAALAKVSA